ncbi:MAG TPA: DUF1841 family protein [Thiobacillaceae bacterium]|nr:DUF1841 family protein [Thiobacillaceae bacterium]HNU63165.1 DUF1841 family protein [Thiobacillaceae bacterium]
MFNPSRDQARDFFFQVWDKYRTGRPLSGLEGMALEHMHRHPEYHPVLEQPERYRSRDWLPELGQTNPFLHLAMHLSVAEQLSIDQPPGVRACYETLVARLGDTHAAQHALMDCMAEMLWHAQRQQRPPDAAAYLDCLETK